MKKGYHLNKTKILVFAKPNNPNLIANGRFDKADSQYDRYGYDHQADNQYGGNGYDHVDSQYGR